MEGWIKGEWRNALECITYYFQKIFAVKFLLRNVFRYDYAVHRMIVFLNDSKSGDTMTRCVLSKLWFLQTSSISTIQ